MAAPGDNHHVNVASATLIVHPLHDGDDRPPLRNSPLHLSGETHVKEPNGHEYSPQSTFVPMDDENDEAPLPPETIAASFEDDANKSALMDEFNGATDQEAELLRWETDDDEAPPPPEMMAAAFEKQRDEEERESGGKRR